MCLRVSAARSAAAARRRGDSWGGRTVDGREPTATTTLKTVQKRLSSTNRASPALRAPAALALARLRGPEAPAECHGRARGRPGDARQHDLGGAELRLGRLAAQRAVDARGTWKRAIVGQFRREDNARMPTPHPSAEAGFVSRRETKSRETKSRRRRVERPRRGRGGAAPRLSGICPGGSRGVAAIRQRSVRAANVPSQNASQCLVNCSESQPALAAAVTKTGISSLHLRARAPARPSPTNFAARRRLEGRSDARTNATRPLHWKTPIFSLLEKSGLRRRGRLPGRRPALAEEDSSPRHDA